MDFARKQMEKYGWTDGKGLGKNENGISQALKPKLKRSMTGVGHDAASDFTEHWWKTLYDKAASNIEVTEKHGNTKKIKTKDDNEFEITNSTWKLKKKKKSSEEKPQEQYEDFFVKTAVLGSGGIKTERIRELDTESEDDQVQKDVFKMTDEELFAACEGRTAHKGARHGLKALGKLARIEQQEKLLLQQSRFNGYSHARCTKNRDNQEIMEVASLNCDENVPISKKKKKKKRRCSKQESDEYENDRANYCCETNVIKKRKDSTNLDITGICYNGNTNCEDVIQDESTLQKIKNKKVKTINNQEIGGKIDINTEVDLQSDVSNRKKREKRKHLEFNSEYCDTDINVSCKIKSHKKNKKAIE